MKKAGEDLADLKDVHQRAGQLVVDVARGMAPTQSGALAGTIRASRLAGGVAVKVGSARVAYANPIHWGWPSRNIEANPFLSNAAIESEAQWTELYYEGLEQIISRVEGDKE